MWKEMGSYRTYSSIVKTGTLVPEFAAEELPGAELQPWCLSLQCPWGENTDDIFKVAKVDWDCRISDLVKHSDDDTV